MFLTTVLCCVVILIGIFLRCKPTTNGGNKLPGPTPLPLLGNLLQIGFRPHVTFTKWAKRYGPIYKIKMGLDDAVVVIDYKLIKELFNEPASAGRLKYNPVMMEFTKGQYGTINSSGPNLEVQRKFTIKTLRNFGFTKASMETMIMDEVQTMLDWFRKQEGSPISGNRIFNAPVINSLWRLATGERCKWEESRPEILDAMDMFYKELMNVSTNGLLFAPVLRFIAPIFFRWNQYKESVNKMMKILEKSITEHKETFNSTDLQDYIDNYILEIGNETDPNSTFYGETGYANLIAGVFDFFLAGSETSSTTLSWTLLYLSEHQEILIKLQKEIDSIVGLRLPTLLDIINMPYTEAVISEILRITSIIPIGNPHGMMSDLIFHGYYLPKGATVFYNLYAVHHDPENWTQPESFRPERFLNEDETKFVQNEALIAFSEGKRKCFGENFAKETLFLFVTCICQQFNILQDPNNKVKVDFEADFGIILGPKPFKVVLSSRKR